MFFVDLRYTQIGYTVKKCFFISYANTLWHGNVSKVAIFLSASTWIAITSRFQIELQRNISSWAKCFSTVKKLGKHFFALQKCDWFVASYAFWPFCHKNSVPFNNSVTLSMQTGNKKKKKSVTIQMTETSQLFELSKRACKNVTT